jgi:hypothetical protein
MREKGFFTTFNLDGRDERGLGKLKGLPRSKIYLIIGFSLKSKIFEKSQFL